jgi:hypothetical protein
MSIKNSNDTIGNRTRNASTNCATVGVQAVALLYSKRPSYADITHETHFRKGNNDKYRIICAKEEYFVLDRTVHVYC